MKIKYIFLTNLTILFVFFQFASIAQLGIKETNSIPNVNAMLDVESPNKGVLIPRMNTGTRDGISSPPAGLMIYNSSTNHFNYWNGSIWTDFNSNAFTLPFTGSGTENSGGQAGLMEIINTGLGNGLYVKSGAGGQLIAGQAYAAYFESSQNGVYATGGAGNLALKTAGDLQFKNNSEGINKILTSTDASGTAVWKSTAILTGLEVNGITSIGTNGTGITEILKLTSTRDIGNIIPGAEGTATFTITNAQPGSTVICTPSQGLPAGIIISHALCEAPNSVEVKFYNASNADINPPAQNFHVTVIR
ncbi:MAG: hypothetical protein V4683_05175 [Bacteroidota bacterium]